MINGNVQSLLVILALLVSACAGEANPNQVQVQDNAFAPRMTTIQVGTTVTWTFNGQAPHNVVFAVGSGLPSSDILNSPASYTVTFPNPGTYNYECSLHAGMVGTI